MRRSLVVLTLALLSSCLPFDQLLDDCRQGRRCDGGAGGGDAGGGGAGGGGGGGGGGGTNVLRDAGTCGANEPGTTTFDGSVAFCFNGFTWENPLPHGSSLYAAWGSSPDDVWAGGEAAMLMHWNGTQWTSYQWHVPKTAPERAADIRAIAGRDGRVYAGGLEIQPSALIDGAWAPQPTSQATGIVDIAPTASSAFALSSIGAVLTDPPQWSTVVASPPADQPNARSLLVRDDGRCLFSGALGSAMLVYGCDGGLQWTLDAGYESQGGKLWLQGPELRIAAGNAIWRLEPDGGATFLKDLGSVELFGGAMIPGTDAGVLVGSGRSMTTLDGTPIPISGGTTSNQLYAATVFADGGGWVVGEHGALVRQVGSQWGSYRSGFEDNLYALFVDDAGVMFGAGGGVLIDRDTRVRRDVGGYTVRDLVKLAPNRWLVISEDSNVYDVSTTVQTVYAGSTGQELHGLLVAGAETWAFGTNTFIQSGAPDGGWRAVSPPTPGINWWKGAQVGDSIVVVGESGAVAVRGAGGGWSAFTSPAGSAFYGVAADGNDHAWLVGSGPTITRFQLSSGTFAPQTLTAPPGNLFDVWGFAANDVWAVGTPGLVYHWNGTSWSLVPVGNENVLERVRGRILANGTHELFITGWYGTVLRLRY